MLYYIRERRRDGEKIIVIREIRLQSIIIFQNNFIKHTHTHTRAQAN